jgi:hypothetical protein
LKANMIAPACSAALPTIGSMIMLRKLTDRPHESDASCSDSHFSCQQSVIVVKMEALTCVFDKKKVIIRKIKV